MSKTRLEAFTDAVIAIIMTVLVLELVSPDSDNKFFIYFRIWCLVSFHIAIGSIIFFKASKELMEKFYG
ncbi:MAG: TMEM175 family protein [Anaerococcus obesiensis]